MNTFDFQSSSELLDALLVCMKACNSHIPTVRIVRRLRHQTSCQLVKPPCPAFDATFARCALRPQPQTSRPCFSAEPSSVSSPYRQSFGLSSSIMPSCAQRCVQIAHFKGSRPSAEVLVNLLSTLLATFLFSLLLQNLDFATDHIIRSKRNSSCSVNE
jgi:hypothetical protein